MIELTDDIRARLRRYRIAVLAGSGTASVVLFLAWRLLLLEGHEHGTLWIKGIEDLRWLVVVAIVAGPFLVALFLHDRARSKLLGIESVTARHRRQSAEEKAGVGWMLPRPPEYSDWRKIIRIAVTLSAATFVIMFMMCLIGTRFREHTFNLWASLGLGLFCACVVLIGCTIQSRFLYPRIKLTLISDGVVQRAAGKMNCIPYSSIQRVCLKPVAGRPSDTCLRMLTYSGGTHRWLRYDFGNNAPVEDIVRAFEAKGFQVEIVQQEPVGGGES